MAIQEGDLFISERVADCLSEDSYAFVEKDQIPVLAERLVAILEDLGVEVRPEVVMSRLKESQAADAATSNLASPPAKRVRRLFAWLLRRPSA